MSTSARRLWMGERAALLIQTMQSKVSDAMRGNSNTMPMPESTDVSIRHALLLEIFQRLSSV
jgi:hypothetical protein